MTRDLRLKQLAELEQGRGSRVINYLTMAKQPLGTAIAEDAVALLHKHLRRMARLPHRLHDAIRRQHTRGAVFLSCFGSRRAILPAILKL